MNIIVSIAPEATCALPGVSDWCKDLLNAIEDNAVESICGLSPMGIVVMKAVIKALDDAAIEAQENG